MAVFTATTGTAFDAVNFGAYFGGRGEGSARQQIDSGLNWVDTNLNSFRLFQTLWYDNNSDGLLRPAGGDYLMGRVDYAVILPAPVIPEGSTEVTVRSSGTTTAQFFDLTSNRTVGTLTAAPYDLQITSAVLDGFTTYFTSYINPVFAMFSGDDRVTLGNRADFFYDPDGALLITLGGGDDTLRADGAGADTIFGGAGDDLIQFTGNGHQIYGGHGDDQIRFLYLSEVDIGPTTQDGGAGNDSIFGDDINPTTLDGGAGNDSIFGDFGDDIFVEGAGSGDDTLDGNSGFDVLDYSGAAAGIVVNFRYDYGTATGGSGLDTFANIEGVFGSDFADQVLGDGSNNLLVGNGGRDLLNGGYGADTLVGGAGVDTASYADDNGGMVVNLAKGTGQFGQAHDDVLVGIENVIGSFGGETIIGSRRDNVLDGGSDGQDSLFGLAGDDRLLGRTGGDRLNGGLGDDIVVGGLAGDVMSGGLGDDHFVFQTALDSTVYDRDVILDFAQIDGDRDLIDVSGLNRMAGEVGREAPFELTGQEGQGRFTGTAGEVRLVLGTQNTQIRIDLDGDGFSDMDILIKSILTLTAQDFIL